MAPPQQPQPQNLLQSQFPNHYNIQPQQQQQQVEQMSLQQQQQQQQHIQMQYEQEAYQKHMMLMSQQNKSIQQQQHQMNMYYQQQQLQQQQQSEPHFDDQSLPPPPLQLLQDPSTVPANSYQMYGELTTLNNGSKMGKVSVQEVNVNRHSNQSTNERPVLPPPPIPDHHSHVSDLQQMQNQIIRKFGHINIDSEHGPSEAGDLPPPPSLPDFTELNNGFGGNSGKRFYILFFLY